MKKFLQILILGLATSGYLQAEIKWQEGSLDTVLAVAKKENKDVLVFWTTSWCNPCRIFKREILVNPKLQDKMKNYINVMLDGDADASIPWFNRYKVGSYPSMTMLSSSGELRLNINPYMPPADLIHLIEESSSFVLSFAKVRQDLNSSAPFSNNELAWVLSQKWDFDEILPFASTKDRAEFFTKVAKKANFAAEPALATKAFFMAYKACQLAQMEMDEAQCKAFANDLLRAIRKDSYIRSLGQNLAVYFKDISKKLRLEDKQVNYLYGEIQAALFSRSEGYSLIERVQLWKVLLDHNSSFAQNHRHAILELIGAIASGSMTSDPLLIVRCGQLAIQAGFMEQAKALAEKSYQSGQNQADYASLLGEYYDATQQYAEAAKWYQTAARAEVGFYGMQNRMRFLLSYLVEKHPDLKALQDCMQLFAERLPRGIDSHRRMAANRMLGIVYKADAGLTLPALMVTALANRKDDFARGMIVALRSHTIL